MTQQEKIKKVEELFDQIQELFPSRSVDLSIFGIDMSQLPESFRIEKFISSEDTVIIKAVRNDNTFDITLFK